MKEAANFQRQHRRAPLREDFLYEEGGHVHKAMSINISEGGLLLQSLPIIPVNDLVPMMLAIPQHYDLVTLSKEQIYYLSREKINNKIIRAKVKIVRKFEGISSADQLFVTQIGFQFVHLESESLHTIQSYVDLNMKNISFLVSQFENMLKNKDIETLVRRIASLLGYDGSGKIENLRQQVLHDYQSLKSL